MPLARMRFGGYWSLPLAACTALLVGSVSTAADLALDESDPAAAAASDVDLIDRLNADDVPGDVPEVKPVPPAQGLVPRSRAAAQKPATLPNALRSRQPATGARQPDVTSEPLARPLPPTDVSSSHAASRTPEASQPADGAGLVRQAFELSKKASDESSYTQIIELCRDGLAAGLKPDMQTYVRQLLGWAHNRRGELRSDADRDDEAFEDFQTAATLDTSKWRYVHNRGVSHATRGEYDQAIEDFNQTIRMNPKYANAYFNRGELRYEKQDYQGALQDYTEALRLAPKDGPIYNSRGHAYYRLEQFREALADYSRAVELAPDNAAAFTNRGDIHADLGQYAEAAKDYRKAIELNPKLARAYQSAAWLMSTCPDEKYRDNDLAIQAAEKAIEIGGATDYRFLETLAAAHASAGDYATALATQKKVLAMSPADVKQRAKARLELYQRNTPYRELPREVSRPPATRQARRPTQR